MSLTPHVRFGIAGGVATIELARPEKKNAITIAMYDAIAEGLRTAGLDSGLATAAVPAADVVAPARRAAERFNALPPESVRETKRLMRAPLAARVQETAEMETRVLVARLATPEAKEAMRAILDRRR